MFPPRHIWKLRKALAYGRLVTVLTSLIAANSALAAPPGAIISNQAAFDYVNLAGGQTIVLTAGCTILLSVIAHGLSAKPLARYLAKRLQQGGKSSLK